MSESKEVLVNIQDSYGKECLADNCNAQNALGDERKPKGYVEIYESVEDGDDQLVGKSNLVVYAGREYIAERIFNVDNASTAFDPTYFITWFGLGTGASGDVLAPDAPVSTDTGLATEIVIDVVGSGYADSGKKKPFDAPVVYEQDGANNNSYLICKVTTTVTSTDANGNNLNEAALWLSDDASGSAANFALFSRVTFPTIVKDISRTLIFVWYIYT